MRKLWDYENYGKFVLVKGKFLTTQWREEENKKEESENGLRY